MQLEVGSLKSQQYGTPEKQICYILAMLEGKAAYFQLHVMSRSSITLMGMKIP